MPREGGQAAIGRGEQGHEREDCGDSGCSRQERTAEFDILTSSVKRAEDDLAHAKRKNNDLKKSAKQVADELHEVNLESDTTAKAVKEAVKEKEDRMVAHDVLKLEVKRLRDQLNARADEVFSLENRKMQLQLSMEERKHEVEVHRELLAAQLKIVQEDIHRATLEMRERAMKVGRLQNKFDILVNKVKREEGEEHSQAYYVIKAAQERERCSTRATRWMPRFVKLKRRSRRSRRLSRR